MTPRMLTPRKTITVLGALTILLCAVFVAGLSVGSVGISLSEIGHALFQPGPADETTRMIILGIRLPRVLLAVVVGAGLSVAGVVFQALLRNALAEPYILGISSGGTVGAILAMSLSAGAFLTPLASLAGSILVMLLVYSLGHRHGQLDTNALLLAGVMVGAFFNAAVLLVVGIFHQEMRTSFLWLMGNLGSATMTSLAIVAPPLLLFLILLLVQARRYNLIAVGDESAMHLGVDVNIVKRISYLLASLMTGLAVSVSGVIGFVGLIIPHICRVLFGPDHRLLLPASMLTGASFMIVADMLARSLIAPAEIPVGAVTAAIGAPLFIYLLKKR